MMQKRSQFFDLCSARLGWSLAVLLAVGLTGCSQERYEAPKWGDSNSEPKQAAPVTGTATTLPASGGVTTLPGRATTLPGGRGMTTLPGGRGMTTLPGGRGMTTLPHGRSTGTTLGTTLP